MKVSGEMRARNLATKIVNKEIYCDKERKIGVKRPSSKTIA